MAFDPSLAWLPLSRPSTADGDDTLVGPPDYDGESLRPSYAELAPEHRFAHGLADWMLRNRLTARELAMLQLMSDLTDREDWSSLVFDDRAMRAWRVEAARSNILISQRTWDWCVAELRMKADEFRQTGSVLVLDAGSRISKSDSTALRDGGVIDILKAAAEEMSRSAGPDELFPSIVNMVHPSFHPLVYGRTRVLPRSQTVPLWDIWAHMGRGVRTVLEPHPLVEMTQEAIGIAKGRPWSPSFPKYDGCDGADVLDYLPEDYGYLQPIAEYLSEDGWREEKPWRGSHRFQWLPCNVEFQDVEGTDTEVRITSYVNNLHPIQFAAVYRALEKIISVSILEWNKVVMRIYPDPESCTGFSNISFGRTAPRINLFGALPIPGDIRQYEDFQTLLEGWDSIDIIEWRRKKDDFLATLRQTPKELWPGESLSGYPMPMCILLRDFVHPEPGLLFTPEEWAAGKNVGRVLVPKWPASIDLLPGYSPSDSQEYWEEQDISLSPDEGGFYVEGPLDVVDRPVRLHLDHRRSGLQVYIKIQSIELTPENPQLVEGDWSLEGSTLNERIVASSLYFFEVENVDGLRVSFRQPTNVSAWGRFNRQTMTTEVASVFAWEGWPIDINQVRTIDHMQSLGTTLVRAGRLLSFPATTQYRLGPAALADPSRPGRVQFVTVSLADPHYQLVSTSRVSPQDFGWWRRDVFPDAYLAARGLPPEVRNLIAEYAFVPDGPLLDRAEVAAFRADTAWERVRVVAEVNRLLWSYFVPAEDSGIPEGCMWSDNCGYLSKSFGEMDKDGESDNRGLSVDGSVA